MTKIFYYAKKGGFLVPFENTAVRLVAVGTGTVIEFSSNGKNFSCSAADVTFVDSDEARSILEALRSGIDYRG